MTPRQARARLGSRKTRRANTNGKNIWGQSTKKGRAVKVKNPRRERRVCVAVRALLKKENA